MRYLYKNNRNNDMNNKTFFYQVLLLGLFISLSNTSQANYNVDQLTKDPKNWATWGGDYAGTRYSKLEQINVKNVKDLQLAWTFSTGVLRGHEGGPLIVDDVIYIHTPFPNIVYALDQKTRSIIWEYKPRQNDKTVIPVMCCDTVNRGLAYAEGKIFLQQSDTTLVALDASRALIDRNGDNEITAEDRVIWSVKNGDPKLGATNTQAPVVMKDKVITGISGGEFGVRGFIVAYDINDGHMVWKGYSMGSDKDMIINSEGTKTWTNGEMRPVGKNSSLKSWVGDQWKIGGGTTWGWFSYDPALNLMYYGSGNPSTWNPVQRPGDNKWSMSIWARNLDTGEVKWVYQMTPHDEWDFDGINEMVLVEEKIKGEKLNLLVHFDRNGFGFTLDRVTGELLVAEKFNKSVNWASHINMKTGRPQVVNNFSTEFKGEDENTENICPAALGSKNQQPVAYSPKTQLFYIPGNNLCMDYEPFEVSYTAGQPYVGATLSMRPSGKDAKTGEAYKESDPRKSHLGFFSAWDATQGKIIWSKSEPFSVWSGALATAGDIVFYGTLEGYLKAVDAKTGEELYRFKTPSGIIGNVSTWFYQGRQYVGVLSGIGGWAGIGIATDATEDSEGLGAVGAYRSLSNFTKLGGVFSVFALPKTK
jgi:PQQ-dependent dehydrogenase (methanol/ethanol family)